MYGTIHHTQSLIIVYEHSRLKSSARVLSLSLSLHSHVSVAVSTDVSASHLVLVPPSSRPRTLTNSLLHSRMALTVKYSYESAQADTFMDSSSCFVAFARVTCTPGGASGKQNGCGVSYEEPPIKLTV